MRFLRRIRFSLGAVMMLVLTAAAASALFAKIRHYAEPILAQIGWRLDVPVLFLLAIALTALALGFWKGHSAVQIMLQMTLACLGCLSLIWIAEARQERAIRYWYQATFALLVVLPMLGRRIVKSEMPRGPRRNWWSKTFEAAFFSYLNLLLVSVGGMLQVATYAIGSAILQK